jgi:hypothetical protein
MKLSTKGILGDGFIISIHLGTNVTQPHTFWIKMMIIRLLFIAELFIAGFIL